MSAGDPWGELRSGAMPGADAEEQERWAEEAGYGGLSEAQTARLADKLLGEETMGRVEGEEVKPGPRRNRHLDGYGDTKRRGY